MRTAEGDVLTMRAHVAARDAMKAVCPHLQVGLTLSLYDLQPQPGGEEIAQQEWENDFAHYLPYIREDDFIGVQNYTRKNCWGRSFSQARIQSALRMPSLPTF